MDSASFVDLDSNASFDLHGGVMATHHHSSEYDNESMTEDEEEDSDDEFGPSEFVALEKARRTMTRTYNDEDLDVVPPKAKKPRRTREINAPESFTDPIPVSQMTRVSNAQRQKKISVKRNAGTDNRRSGTQSKHLGEAIRIFGYRSVECFQDSKSRRYRLKGMAQNTKLFEWQLNPVAWMVKRENGLAPPYGGVLAGTMGMGKTLMSLACVVGNPPPETDSQGFSGATLVVVPKDSVARQWQEQISQHVDCIRPEEVYYYKKLHHAVSGGDISRYKIVITTYQELLNYPSEDAMKKLKEEFQGEEFDKAFKAAAGEVFSVKWFRIIFDEAHEMKNVATKTFKACYALTMRHVWLISGTPLINGGVETFPYVKGSSVALDSLINTCTYRSNIHRTVDDKFLRERIMKDLMPFKSEVRWVKISEQERFLYDEMTLAYNESDAAASAMYMSRQRQLISHPYGIERAFQTDFGEEKLAHISNGLKTIELGAPTGEHLECGICGTESMKEAWIIDKCDHTFCCDCSTKTWRFRAQADICQHKGCNLPYDRETDVRRVLTLSTMESECDRLDEEEAAAHAEPSDQTFSGKKYGWDSNGVAPTLTNGDLAYIKLAMRENGGYLPLGSKLTVARDLILEYQKERIQVGDELQSPKIIYAWWNESAEKQADGRVHRVGQTQVTSSVVIKAENTIDNYVVQLQAEKSKEIAHILQDDAHGTQLYSELELIKLTAPHKYKELVRTGLAVIRKEDEEAERL
ncbi:SNF2 family N-terminal domain-containing protein [Colletotrichum phormii]|uniref:SNF2 family N-terminal domain-containing protein n=1 Tax=Colletotrichum phormii TaxID=359342 RepID=A0AAI9ZBQ1_9PEZI|nr:SNF2 family N-terminal domain-containing protein [Colletotrichum phormii]KAK1621578.1 SNF2 family N-terminal domain-containing protein [Colletotrichum phormii]